MTSRELARDIAAFSARGHAIRVVPGFTQVAARRPHRVVARVADSEPADAGLANRERRRKRDRERKRESRRKLILPYLAATAPGWIGTTIELAALVGGPASTAMGMGRPLSRSAEFEKCGRRLVGRRTYHTVWRRL